LFYSAEAWSEARQESSSDWFDPMLQYRPPNFHKKHAISTEIKVPNPLTFMPTRSIFQFTGGAIFQKERAEEESSGESVTRLTRHSGNWMTRMEPKKLLQRNGTADENRKRGSDSQVLNKSEVTGDCDPVSEQDLRESEQQWGDTRKRYCPFAI